MEAKELMIGDWVKVTEDDEYGFFHEITCQVQNLNDFGDIGANNNDYKEEDVWPIPLTVEIMQKNGFLKSWISNYCKEDSDLLLEISVGDNERILWTINGFEYSILRFDYVHELQHALKLCGIEKEIVL